MRVKAGQPVNPHFQIVDTEQMETDIRHVSGFDLQGVYYEDYDHQPGMDYLSAGLWIVAVVLVLAIFFFVFTLTGG